MFGLCARGPVEKPGYDSIGRRPALSRRIRAGRPRGVAVARSEGSPAHGRGLLVAAPRAGRGPPPPDRVRRSRGRTRRALGRAGPVGERAVADRARGDLGRGSRRTARRPARVRGQAQGRRRRARADRQPPPHSVRRAAFRVLQRGSAADRADRGQLRVRAPGRRRRRHRQAFRRQRLRDRTDDSGRAGRRADAARAVPRAVRVDRPRGRRLVGDGRVQRRQAASR